ncbi:helix-turn-helix domain-containing protein [Roseibium aggregatum]|jgi:DNA-binding transcriptional MerR regulator|uniref:helix-turn-helix domain-containing protein n=1 Tax=Roseibium aggregatum TaxID=187304 RepID=UPI001E55C101|nr:helix-turn-helix domain-containing protein [Roseibium aggregatum]MEC9422685.1 helix-turn-helix domain-containing protein [Pseudomonadota bacterium]MEE2866229.1 helix-turn-helix domain-containing protein [Pseudomonadota bacterium]UES40655.1 MerR family transcriptional regulator [Roseibium aggregatum]
MKLMDISEVSKQTGIAASAIRHYEEKGLITSVGRRGLKRLFGPEVLDQLALITLGKTGGFSLEEIKSMFGSDGRPALSRPGLHMRADELDRQIHTLEALRDMIRHVADCPAPSHMECPKFQQLIRISGRRSRNERVTHKLPPVKPGRM